MTCETPARASGTQKTPATHSNQGHRCRTDFHAIHAVGDHLPYCIHTTLDESGVETVEQVHFDQRLLALRQCQYRRP